MKKLSEHNKEHGQGFTYNGYGTPPERFSAGVLCDTCENSEMYLENPNVVLTSYPPQQSVICPYCNKRGYKVI